MNSTDKVFYVMGLFLLGGIAVLAVFQASGLLLLTNLGLPCSFRSVSGLYCPGCGGTHALCALVAGDILTSAREHLAVPYTVFGFAVFLLWNTVCTILGKATGRVKMPVMHFYTAYVYIGLAIILTQWILKLVVQAS